MKKIFLFALTLAAVFLFYRVDSVVAMAVEQNPESIVEAKPEQSEESDAEAKPEQPEESDAEAKPEQSEESDAEAKPEQNEESDTEAKPEQSEESDAEVKPGQPEESAAEAELLQTAEALAEPVMKAQTESESETVSTGDALMEWLEAHRSIGGRVKLTDHVVLDGEYNFVSGGINSPAIFVDADQYTITVTGKIELLSNGRLTFSGQPDHKSIFCVAEKGVLSICGISVESGQYALWQEEGACLEVSDCSISGSIHYADTPFVMYYRDFICAVVEKGQTAGDVLPRQISCSVNRQGRLSHDEWIPVSWNLEGTERQQEQRRRFVLQGSFSGAASAEPALCTVAYNDHPLTFTDVSASVSGDRYTFCGGFTAPEESLPFTVMAEYSFDGENWFLYEEQKVTNTDAGFYIGVRLKQRSMAEAANIYIRLQWNDNGTRYFSNVLCYAANNLEQMDDIGGSRGGGTSIINSTENPSQKVGGASSDNGEAVPDENKDIGSHDDEQEVSSENSYAEEGEGKSGQPVAVDETSKAIIPKMSVVQAAGAEPEAINPAEQIVDAEPKDTDAESKPLMQSPAESQNINITGRAADAGQTDDQESHAEPSYTGAKPQNEISPHQGDSEISEKNKGTVLILVAAGFVLLSGFAGMAGFYVHFRSGTNR